jgi:hypothetical protein
VNSCHNWIKLAEPKVEPVDEHFVPLGKKPQMIAPK